MVKVSLCSPGSLRTHPIDHAGLKLRGQIQTCPSLSSVLGLKVCTTTLIALFSM